MVIVTFPSIPFLKLFFLTIASPVAINMENREAIRILQQLIASYPLEAEAYQRLAKLLLLADRDEEALQVLKQGLVVNPNAEEFYNHLGRADAKLGRNADEYQRVLKLNPNYPLVHYHLARSYEGKGEQERARQSYQQFLAIWSQADEDIPEIIEARRKLAGKWVT
jgi:O-antigen biosynthesis protein